MTKYIYAVAFILAFSLVGCNKKDNQRRSVTRTQPAYLNNTALLNGCQTQQGQFLDPVTQQQISCQYGNAGYPQFYDPYGQQYPVDPYGATCFSGYDPYTYECLDYYNPYYTDPYGSQYYY